MFTVTHHAARRLAQRGITVAECEDVVRRHLGSPLPGDGGNLVFVGPAGGRTLKVVLSPDRASLVSAFPVRR